LTGSHRRGDVGRPGDVTALLLRWSQGDRGALDELLPFVYEECRRVAGRQLRREGAGHTLQPTALVHELYLRLVDQERATWRDRAHFYGVAGQVMRRILVDHARARLAKKRDASRMVLPPAPDDGERESARIADVIAIDQALERLGRQDPEQQRIVELRYFAGLTVEETAHVLARSPRTVKREWQLARAWLFRELHPEGLGPARGSGDGGRDPPPGSG
jgi:RNA polymerase sigma-70 factor, ECF subfamily